jgi:ribosomal-protein-serine acetyltransferase
MLLCKINDSQALHFVQATDAEELFALTEANRAYLRTWLPWLDWTTKVADTRHFIQSCQQQFADNKGFVAVIRYHGELAGVIGYNEIDWHNQVGYIGYWLAADRQGQGIITNACRSIINYGFFQLNLNRIVIACAAQNQRSQSIPKRLGFSYEGTAREAEWLYNHFVDHEIYALLKRNWREELVLGTQGQ